MASHDHAAIAAAIALTSLLSLTACGGGGEPGRDATHSAADATIPPGAQTDPSAERQFITLTGCVQRSVRAGEYTLAYVATAGVPPGSLANEDDKRSWTADDSSTRRSQARLMAASTYRLIETDDDQQIEQYEGKRVTVRGRLAADTPVATTGQVPATGVQTDSSATSATVVGTAAPLRGLHVESVREVSDSCDGK